MDNKNKNPNVPNLRFKDFGNYEWNIDKIYNIAPLQRGFDLPEQNIIHGSVPVVYSNGIKNYHNQYKAKAPGIITGRSGTVGKFTYIENGYYWPHNTSLWVTDFKCNYPKFIYFLFQYVKFENYSTGSGVPTLNRNDIHDKKVGVPKIEEQIKIATFLTKIDERIELQNKIIEDMDSLKQSISIQLYDQLELNKKLCDVCEVTKGKQINGTDLLKKGQYYMMNGGLAPSGYLDQYNTLENTISISEGGNSCGYVQYNKEKFWSGGHCYTLNDLSGDINSNFLYFFLKAKEKDIMALRIGTGLPNIQKKDIESFLIPVPNMEIQNNIVEILDSICSKIDVLNKQLEYYKQQKQYLLNNLFI